MVKMLFIANRFKKLIMIALYKRSGMWDANVYTTLLKMPI